MRRAIGSFLGLGALIAVLAGQAQAQTPVTPWDWGLTAGVNIATLSGEDADDADNLIGFMAGGSLLYSVSDRLGVQTELVYSRRGAKGTFEGQNIELRLGYIDIPVMLKFPLGTATQMLPALFIGPYFGWRVGCDAKFGNVTVDCDDDIELKDADFGIVGGIGFDIRNFGVFARFQQGLTSLDDSSDNSKIYNRVITIGGRLSLRGLGQ